MASAARSVLLTCLLCLACAATTTVALATRSKQDRHRFTGSSRSCQHKKHRRCLKSRGHNTHKHQRHSSPKPTAPKRSGSTDSWSSTPTPVLPGSGSTPSGSPSPVPAGGAPTETPSTPAGPAHVQVIAKEYSFTLSRREVPAGKVIINFVNDGEDEHNLNTLGPSEASESQQDFANTQAGVQGNVTLTLSAGSYKLFCSLPEHEAKGMKATLVVN
jgi:plastocyanin